MDWLFHSPNFFLFFAVVYGLLIGSFLNVVIYRLPKMMERQWQAECHAAFPKQVAAPSSETFNLAIPQSTCPSCKKPIKFYDNIPVVSWLLLGGKCRHCKNPISVRYPLIEALTALLVGITAYVLSPSMWTIAVIGVTCALIALCFIDIDTMLLPDAITLPLMWAGILLSVVGISPVPLQDSVIGAMAGYLSLWGIFHIFKLLTGKEGMGYGDFKLLAALGAWLGWVALPIVILIASAVGTVAGLVIMRVKRTDGSVPFSFGPYLAAGGWIALLWGQQIINWYLGFY